MENKEKAFEIVKTVIKMYEYLSEKKFNYLYRYDPKFHRRITVTVNKLQKEMEGNVNDYDKITPL